MTHMMYKGKILVKHLIIFFPKIKMSFWETVFSEEVTPHVQKHFQACGNIKLGASRKIITRSSIEKCNKVTEHPKIKNDQ
jgi:hypothetical protein